MSRTTAQSPDDAMVAGVDDAPGAAAPSAADMAWEHGPDPLAVVEGNGSVVEANPSFARLLGRLPAGLADQSIVELLEPVDDGPLDPSDPGPLIVRIHDPNGAVRRHLWSSIGIGSDRRLVRLDRERPPVRLDHALSHDLRARLRAVRSFLQLIVPDIEATMDPPTTDYLDRALSAAVVADRMTERLVRYMRLTPDDGTREITPLEPLVQAALARCEHPPVATIESLPTIATNPGLLVEALIELLDNAGRYPGSGEPAAVDISGGTSGPGVVLRIVDHGMGIAPERIERALALCTQVHRAESLGSGMGLPLAVRIIEGLGGSLSLTSDGETGTTVEVRLPDHRDRTGP